VTSASTSLIAASNAVSHAFRSRHGTFRTASTVSPVFLAISSHGMPTARISATTFTNSAIRFSTSAGCETDMTPLPERVPDPDGALAHM
jgi:hypothetical protein